MRDISPNPKIRQAYRRDDKEQAKKARSRYRIRARRRLFRFYRCRSDTRNCRDVGRC